MGFNKKILPSLEEFKKRVEENPDYLFYIKKADAIIGPPDTVDYLYELLEKENAENQSHSN
jgi:hypothetical protein